MLFYANRKKTYRLFSRLNIGNSTWKLWQERAVPSKNYFWTVSEIMKADLKQPQTSTRTSRASNKQADGFWWLWIEFFFPACLSFMAVLARLLKRAFAAPLSDKGHGVGASGRRLIRNEKKAVESSVGRESQMGKTSCYNVCQWKVKSGGKLNFSVSCHYSLLLLT